MKKDRFRLSHRFFPYTDYPGRLPGEGDSAIVKTAAWEAKREKILNDLKVVTLGIRNLQTKRNAHR